MSYADAVFKQNAIDILTNGTNTKGEEVRPHWEDGTPAYTIKKFGVVNCYDLREEFPLMTLRPTAFKSCVNEILWIYQKASNNIKDLKPHIWDEWADETGSIGKAYGYQIGLETPYYVSGIPDRVLKDPTKTGTALDPAGNGKIILPMNQMEKVLYDLKRTPFSRRIRTDMYNVHDLPDMHLYPCCHSVDYNVTDENGVRVLNMVLSQRSNDMLAANNWNVAQYAALLMMVAHTVGMVPGKLLHVITDQHIYDRHIEIVKELLDRKPRYAPTVRFEPGHTNFFEYTENDFIVEGYDPHPQIKNIPIAI